MNSRSKQIAAATTLLICLLIGLTLGNSYIAWSPGRPWPPEPEPYIELAQAEEFIEPEPIPLPAKTPGDLSAPALTEEKVVNDSRVAPQTGTQVESRGVKAQPAQETVSHKPNKAVVEEKPKPAKPVGSNDDNARKKEREAIAKRTDNKVDNAFARASARNNANSGSSDNGRSGRPDGKPDSAGPANSQSTVSGVNYGTLGGGWNWPSYGKISSAYTGSVILALIIDKDGRVKSAKVIGGKAPAGSNASVQAQCIAAAKSRRFTRRNAADAPDESQATLTFTFRNPGS